MMHRFSTALAVRAVSLASAIGLIACSDLTDSVSPEHDPAPAARTAGQTAAASAAVQDAITRLIPSLGKADDTVALDRAFRELATALGEPDGPAVRSAYATARAALEHYASTRSEDDADVAAVRLALDEAR